MRMDAAGMLGKKGDAMILDFLLEHVLISLLGATALALLAYAIARLARSVLATGAADVRTRAQAEDS
jgi:hypothetical protein